MGAAQYGYQLMAALAVNLGICPQILVALLNRVLSFEPLHVLSVTTTTVVVNKFFGQWSIKMQCQSVVMWACQS